MECLPSTTFLIFQPFLRQIQFPIDHDISFFTRVCEKHSDLTVLDAPGCLAVLPPNSRRFLSLPEKSRFIHHQYAAGLPYSSGDIFPQFISDKISAPYPTVQRLLNFIRRAFPALFGQLPV